MLQSGTQDLASEVKLRCYLLIQKVPLGKLEVTSEIGFYRDAYAHYIGVTQLDPSTWMFVKSTIVENFPIKISDVKFLTKSLHTQTGEKNILKPKMS